MDERLALAGRMRAARFQTAANRREAVSQERMADLVGKLCKRSLHQTQWARYESGESEPPIDVVKATAKISGLSEAYMFGIATTVDIDASQLRYLTPDEIARAEKKVAEDPTLSARVTGKGARKRRA